MKSLADPRFGLMTIVGVLSLSLGSPLLVSHASAQDAPPAQTDQEKGAAALAAANEALANGRYKEAADKYAEALTFLPGNQEAINGQAQAMQMLNQGDTSPAVAESIQIQRERALAEFNASYNSAREKLAAAQYEDATREVIGAMALLDTRRGVLSDTEYRTLRDKGDELAFDIDKAREVAEIKAANDAVKEAQAAKDREEKAERARRQQQVDEGLKRVRQLQMELKYDEALQVIDEVLFIDELNPSAMALRELIVTTKLYRDYMETLKLKELGFGQLRLETQQSLLIPRKNLSGPGARSVSGIVEYPTDWPQLSMRRGAVGGYQESDAERSVRQRLQETRVPVDFNNNSLEQVVAFMEQVTGLDIYVDYKALGLVGIDKEEQVSLKLQDVPMSTALERILDQLGEGGDKPQWAIEDGVLTISSDEALRKRTVLLVYDIRDLLFQVPNFDNAPQLDLDAALDQGQQQGGGGGGGGSGGGGFGGGGGGGGGGSSSGSIFGESGEDPERISRDEMVQQIVNIIQENVDPEGWRDLGGDTGSLQELNGNLIITNTPNNHREIEGLLSQLREIRALQINVESRFLTVSTDFFERIGVDLDIYFNTNNDMFSAAKAVDPNFHLSDFYNTDGSLKDAVVWGNFDQVANPAPGNPFNTVPTGAITGVPTGVPPTTITNVIGPTGSPIRLQDGQGFGPIAIQNNHKNLIEQLADFDVGSFAGVALANPALAVGIQFLDDVQVDLLIEATQADRRSVSLTAPRLTFFNGQRAWVAVTTQRAYVSSLTAVTGDSSGAFQPRISTLQDGFVLDVEGVISADRRYVTMTVLFDFSEFLGFRQSSAADFGGAAGGGGGVDGGGSASEFTGQVELPVIRVSQIRTTVSVPDKGTVLLGGQRHIREVELENGVPVLSKIPWINRFFTNRLSSKEEQTLLILIRPEIIIQQENEDMLFPGLNDNLGGAASYMN